MIVALDHAVLLCPDIQTGIAVYEGLLGFPLVWQSRSDGMATAIFRVANTALELIAPDEDGAVAEKLRTQITDEGPGLKSLVFETGDIGAAHHKLTRRGLKPHPIVDGLAHHTQTGETLHWQRFRCDDTQTSGVKTFVLQREKPLPVSRCGDGSVTALDHLVIETPNPDRALALYGARLGLDLALDRTAPEWKTRFLFFRTGGLTLEIIHRLGAALDPGAPDKIWGVTWAVDDLEAARARLADQGLNVSEARSGRKPGSRVFTVRDGTLGVPTLFIAHQAR